MRGAGAGQIRAVRMTGQLYAGKAPDRFDGYFLELELNGVAVARWTYMPKK